MAEPATDVFGTFDADSVVRGAMPQPINAPKIMEGVKKSAADEAAEKKPIIDQTLKSVREGAAEAHKKYDELEPPKIEKWDAEAEKRKYSTNPIEAFGSIGFIAAMIGSALTKTPMVNALNAGAAAMTAIKDKDDKGYERAYEAFKTNTDHAVKQWNIQQQAYDAATKLLNTDRDAGLAQLSMLTVKYQDQQKKALIDGGYFDKLHDAINADNQMRLKTVELIPKIELAHAQKNAADEMRRDGATDKQIYREIYAPSSVGRTTLDAQRRENIYRSLMEQYKRDNDLASDDEVPADMQVRFQQRAYAKGGSQITKEQAGLAAERIIAGDPRATTGFARSPEAMAEIQAGLVSKLGSDRAAAEAIRINSLRYAADLAGSRELGKRDAFLTLAENEAKSLLPRVREASHKVDRTDFPSINSLILAANRGTGGEDVIKLGVAIQSLIPVYARILKPTGVLTEGDFKRAEHIIDQRWSQGQVDAALDQMLMEMNSARRGLEVTREEFPRPHVPGNKPNPTTAAPATPAPSVPALPAITDRIVGQEYELGGEKVIWGGDGHWYPPAEWRSKGN